MKILIYHEKHNPSTDFFILPMLKSKNLNYTFWTEKFIPEDYFLLIVVRYFSEKLLKFLNTYKKKMLAIVYFMDDNLFCLEALLSLPKRYAYKIFTKAYRYKNLLHKLGASILVSNEYLAERYKNYNPQIIYPYPILGISSLTPYSEHRIIFYHATASHKKEFPWLANLIRNLKDYYWEVVADKSNFKYFKNLSNVWLLYPMPWNIYQQFLKEHKRHIGIAFQFDNLFNRTRSYVKFFNILQMGAVGLYSETFPAADLIKKFDAGIVLPLDFNNWIKVIKNISQEIYQIIFLNSLQLLSYLKNRALESYEKVRIF